MKKKTLEQLVAEVEAFPPPAYSNVSWVRIGQAAFDVAYQAIPVREFPRDLEISDIYVVVQKVEMDALQEAIRQATHDDGLLDRWIAGYRALLAARGFPLRKPRKKRKKREA